METPMVPAFIGLHAILLLGFVLKPLVGAFLRKNIAVEDLLTSLESRTRSHKKTQMGYVVKIGAAQILYRPEDYQDGRRLESFTATLLSGVGTVSARFEDTILVEWNGLKVSDAELSDEELCQINRIAQVIRFEVMK
jgi:hypothetical protein